MKQSKGHVLVLLFCVIITISGCSNTIHQTTFPSPTEPNPIEQHTKVTTSTPTPTLLSSPTPTATLEPVCEVCSPLEGIELSDLHKITSQGFTPPAPFRDDGHPAVDLAFFTFKEMPSMIGHPVQSIFPGTVSLVIKDRYPYGNAIMIETPLDLISSDILCTITLPTPIPQDNLDRFGQCNSEPQFKDLVPLSWSEDTKSLYVLYAHLLEEPVMKEGEIVSCGQVIGAVGSTGNSAAEHLHLEVRTGPADAQFGTLAMYSPDASVQERYSYCIWTSSGRFQTFNPVMFWGQEP